jgi:hypothetical protein
LGTSTEENAEDLGQTGTMGLSKLRSNRPMTQDPNNSSPKNLSRDSGLASNALVNNGLNVITPIEPGVQLPGKAEGMLRFAQVRSAATWLEMGLLVLASGLLIGGLGWNNQWVVAIGVFLALPIATTH